VTSLGHCGKKAIPVLLECLQSTDVNLRRRAILALGDVGPDAAGTATTILEHMHESELAVREALQEIKAVAIIPNLIALLDQEKVNGEVGMGTLGSYGPEAWAAAPRLLTYLDDRRNALRYSAARTLLEIGENLDRALPVLLEALEDNPPRGSIQVFGAFYQA